MLRVCVLYFPQCHKTKLLIYFKSPAVHNQHLCLRHNMSQPTIQKIGRSGWVKIPMKPRRAHARNPTAELHNNNASPVTLYIFYVMIIFKNYEPYPQYSYRLSCLHQPFGCIANTWAYACVYSCWIINTYIYMCFLFLFIYICILCIYVSTSLAAIS